MATGDDARSIEAVGTKIFENLKSPSARLPTCYVGIKFFAGVRSDAFFFDYDGIKNLFDTSGGRNFTAHHLQRKIAVDR